MPRLSCEVRSCCTTNERVPNIDVESPSTQSIYSCHHSFYVSPLSPGRERGADQRVHVAPSSRDAVCNEIKKNGLKVNPTLTYTCIYPLNYCLNARVNLVPFLSVGCERGADQRVYVEAPSRDAIRY